MPLSLKQIGYFLAAAETGQFSAAAAKAHVTQTAITAAIRQLEETLGVQLFARHHATGVSLTVDGQKFLQHAYAISAAVNAALRDPGLTPQQVSGRLRVGASHSMLGSYIVPAVARFMRAYPEVDLQLIEMERERIEQRLIAGRIDIGVLWLARLDHRDALHTVCLTHSRRQLWLPALHPLLEKRDIALSDLANLPYVLYGMDETPQNTGDFMRAAGVEPDVRYRVTSIEAVRSLVAQGLAVTVLADVAYRPFSSEGLRIEARPITDTLPPIEIGLASKQGREPSAAENAFSLFMQLTFGGPGAGIRVY